MCITSYTVFTTSMALYKALSYTTTRKVQTACLLYTNLHKLMLVMILNSIQI